MISRKLNVSCIRHSRREEIDEVEVQTKGNQAGYHVTHSSLSRHRTSVR